MENNNHESATFKADKPFKSYDEQIQLLKSRGLIIQNNQFARHMLQTYSYYDLINGNLDQLMLHRHPDLFKSGTTFEDLVQIRYTEDRIKSIFLRQILMIEKTFKSTLSYYISDTFGVNSNDGGYLSQSNYSGTHANIVRKTMKTLRNIRDGNVGNKKQGGPINHYRENHNHIPPWILVDELTLGETIYWFKGINSNGKGKISSQLLHVPTPLTSNLQLELFQITIDILREFRNFFAHNSVLSHMSSNRELKFELLTTTNSEFNLLNGITVNVKNRHNLLACFLSILVLSNDYDQLAIFLIDLKQTVSILSADNVIFIIEEIFNLPLAILESADEFSETLKTN